MAWYVIATLSIILNVYYFAVDKPTQVQRAERWRERCQFLQSVTGMQGKALSQLMGELVNLKKQVTELKKNFSNGNNRK